MDAATSRIRPLLSGIGIIPVVTIGNPEKAVPLARALQRGGAKVIEITLRPGRAIEAVRNVVKECPEITVGIGTVTSIEQLDVAADTGAAFAVSPGFSAKLVDHAAHKAIPYLPAVSTNSEVLQAMNMGLDTLKFFPAEALGGITTLTGFADLYPDVAFCPTGGINAGNLHDYLALANVLCIGGSWLTPAHLIETDDWHAIEARVAGSLNS